MGGIQFFETLMGKRFYEGTMPALVREIKALNENLSKLVEAQASRAADVPGREIMILPSRDGEMYQAAILTPLGMDYRAAHKIAQEVLENLEEADRKAGRDHNDAGWTLSTLLSELERKGFMKLESFNGPTWDRRGA